MLPQLLRISKHSAVYSLGSIAEKGLAFLLIPIYTRYLTTEDYGVLGILLTSMAVLMMFSSMGVLGGLAMSYNQKQDDSERRKAVGTALLTTVIGVSILLVMIMVFAGQLSNLFFSTDAYTTHFRLMGLMLFFDALLLVVFVTMRVQERSTRYVTIVMVKFLMAAGLNIGFVVGMGWGVKGVLTGITISSGLVMVYVVPRMVSEVRPLLSWDKFKGMLNYGLPYIPSNIMHQIATLSDRYFLLYMVGSAEVGLYTLGNRFGMVVAAVIITPFLAAWGPFFWSIHQQPNAMEIYARVTTYYFVITGFAALALAVLAKEMLQILTTSEFYSAYRVVGLIALAWVLQGTVNLFSLGVGLAKKMWWIPVIVGIGAMINVGLNWLLIPIWQMEGAAVATVASFSVVPLGMLVVSRRYHKVPYEWVRIGKVVLIGVMVFGVSLAIDTGSVVVDAMVKGMTLMLFPVGLWGVRFFRDDEIRKVREWVRI